MQKIIENMSAQPATCVIASVLLFFFAALENYILMDALLEMHRSKSALKKLKRQYTFFQKYGFCISRGIVVMQSNFATA